MDSSGGRESSPRIMVVGSSNTDMVIATDRLPLPGETVMGGKFLMVPGGKGANQAVAAARLGGRVTFVARVGSDVFGEEAVANFRNEGIETEFITRDPEEPSGVALIFVDSKGENVIAVAPGSNGRLFPGEVEAAAGRMSECSVLVLQLEVPMETVVRAAELGRERGVPVLLNPAPVGVEGLPGELLRNVDVLVPNETETRTILGLAPDAAIDEESARRLLDLGVGGAVVTMGASGVLVVTPERCETIPGIRVTAVDSTAAGDAFCGATAFGLAGGSDLFEASRFAVRAAALSVTRMGAQSSLPTASEVASFNP